MSQTSSIERPFAQSAAGTKEIGFFIPYAEDSSNRVVNLLADKLTSDSDFDGINMVLFLTKQPKDRRVQESPWLRKQHYLHNDLLAKQIFPFLNERGLRDNPNGILLSPELLEKKYEGRLRLETHVDPNHPDFIAKIRRNRQLVQAFSIRNLVIFDDPLIQAFAEKGKYGLVNSHPAELPGYRGLFGPFWTVKNGKNHLASTLHAVVRQVDAGDVLNIKTKPINGYRKGVGQTEARTPISNYYRDAAPQVADMIAEQIHNQHVLGRFRPAVPQEGESIRVTLPTDLELEAAFQQQGIRLSDASDAIMYYTGAYSTAANHEHQSQLYRRIAEDYYPRKNTFDRRLSKMVHMPQRLDDPPMPDQNFVIG